mgnify:CR=1 FL=1
MLQLTLEKMLEGLSKFQALQLLWQTVHPAHLLPGLVGSSVIVAPTTTLICGPSQETNL